MLCMHCLEDGEWEDEDKCPNCAEDGHESPWVVSKCGACNAEYYKKMDELCKKIGVTPHRPNRDKEIKDALQMAVDYYKLNVNDFDKKYPKKYTYKTDNDDCPFWVEIAEKVLAT